MFIAAGRPRHPPSVRRAMSICVSNERQSCLHFREHMALLRRAERPTTRTINITLLRRGGRKMVKLRTLAKPG